MPDFQIKEKLQTVFENVFEKKIDLSESLRAEDVEGWDSMRHISLLFAAEEAFGIRFPLDRIGMLNNVGELMGLISSLLAKNTQT
jgi:acyl carrier protein